LLGISDNSELLEKLNAQRAKAGAGRQLPKVAAQKNTPAVAETSELIEKLKARRAAIEAVETNQGINNTPARAPAVVVQPAVVVSKRPPDVHAIAPTPAGTAAPGVVPNMAAAIQRQTSVLERKQTMGEIQSLKEGLVSVELQLSSMELSFRALTETSQTIASSMTDIQLMQRRLETQSREVPPTLEAIDEKISVLSEGVNNLRDQMEIITTCFKENGFI